MNDYREVIELAQRAERAEELLRKIAWMAHAGGLDGMSQDDVIVEVRRLTIPWWDQREASRRQREAVKP